MISHIRSALALSLIVVCLASAASAQSIPPRLHARIIQLEDERNLNGDELTKLLKHSSPQVRARAALAIGRIGDQRATAALLALLQTEKDEAVRAEVAFALGEMEDAQAIPALLEFLTAGKYPLAVRARPAEALGKIAAIQANAEALGQTTVAQINERLSEQLPAPQSALTAERKLLITLTITALMRLRAPAAVAPLAGQLKSDDADVRAQAANALARLRQPLSEVVPALLESLSNEDADVRANAARVWGGSKDARAVEPLIKLLTDKNARVQVSAIRALAAFADQQATEPLLALGASLVNELPATGKEYAPQLNLLREVATALGILRGERAWAFLQQLSRTLAFTPLPEVEVAVARFGIMKALNDRTSFWHGGWVGRECSNWKNAAIGAQIAVARVETGDDRDAEKGRNLLSLITQRISLPQCDPRGWPEVVRAMNKLGGHWPDVLLRKLKSDDVIVRAAIATLLAEGPDEKYLPTLLAALQRSKRDVANDAKLALLTAVSKHKSVKTIVAIKAALDDQDHLVRRHAVDLLKQMGAGDFSDRIGTVQTGHNQLFYQRAVARLNKKVTATIHTNKGTITLELFPQDAPLTVNNFITLARRGFYNNLTFHRVVPNFVIQGGDPRGDGEGGPGYQIRCEINERPYTRGAVGMALSGKDTGGSQFFITHSPQPHLDGGYTVFGQVTSGMEVVDKIVRGDMIKKVVIIETGAPKTR
jgi:cyclophilin family peptidyl-prolyl cis-trans isomerase/HEAT repeat protein